MAELPDLSLNAWAVLTLLVDDGPGHGFALSKQLARGTEIGQVWSVSRPLVYRALDQLVDRGLATAGPEQPGTGGPSRRQHRATRRGRAAVDRWRRAPVTHLRDVRPDLVLKLVLTARAGLAIDDLLAAQKAEFADLQAGLRLEQRSAEGPGRVVAVWRYELAQAVDRTLDRLA